MAVIGKIQKNSLLLLIVIGLAMLAFIFTDFLKGGPSEIERTPTALINGDPIDQDKWNDTRDAYVNRAKNESEYQQKEFTEADKKNAEDQAFNEFVRKAVLKGEYEKLGIICTTDELNDMIHGKHIHPWVLQIGAFNGALGFSKDSVRNFINRLELEPVNASDEDYANWKTNRSQWRDFEKELKEARRADKYVTLIKKGLFINKLEAQNEYNDLYNKKDVSFVLQRYSSIPAEEVEVTDEDVKNFFNDHKNDPEYEQEEARDVRMVSFPVVATDEDVDELKTQLGDLKTSFNLSQNTLGFMYQNSDADFLSDSTIFKMAVSDRMAFSANGGSYPETIDSEIQGGEVGDVVGPFLAYNNDLKRDELAIAKILETPTETQAWVRHILISSGATRSEEKAKSIADSLIKVIKAEDNFVALVSKVSEDPGSIQNNGEYKWFSQGMMVPTFNDASFNGAIGQIQLVKTSYGYHIVEVLGRAERITPVLAIVTKIIKPSDKTLTQIEELAYEFIYSVSDSKQDSAFKSIATDSSMNIQATRIYLSNDYVVGVTKSEQLLKQVFSNTEKGTMTNPVLDGNKYIVAITDNVIEEGIPEFDDVKDFMRQPALRDKQAAVYIQKMSGKGSLEEIGPSLIKGISQTSEITFTSNEVYTGGQAEPEIIGQLFTNMTVGQLTKPIQGNEGIYVFIINSETPADETTDLEITRTPMQVKRALSSDSKVIQALREKANLTDNRRKIKFQ